MQILSGLQKAWKRNLTELMGGGGGEAAEMAGCRTSHSYSQLQQEEMTFKGRVITTRPLVFTLIQNP